MCIYIVTAIILSYCAINYYNTHIDIAGTWVRAKSNAISNNNGGIKKIVFDDYGNGYYYCNNQRNSFEYEKDGRHVSIVTETEYTPYGLLKIIKEQGKELHRDFGGTYLTIKHDFEFSGKYVKK